MPDEPDRQTATTTRARILQAAADECIDVGPAEVSLDAIARRAGEPLSALRTYFPSRLELMAELAWQLYVENFRTLPGRREGDTTLASFLTAYVLSNRKPRVQLIWHLGYLIHEEHPENIDSAYWHLVSELEKRIKDHGIDADVAHERAQVLAPALLHQSRRVAQGLAGDEEIDRFVTSAVPLFLVGAPVAGVMERGAAPTGG